MMDRKTRDSELLPMAQNELASVRDLLQAEIRKNEKLEKALVIVCTQISDHQCPNEFDLICFPECDACPKGDEERYDTQRDINCWKRWAIEKAGEEGGDKFHAG